MKRILEKINFKKSMSLVLTLAMLFLVSCGGGDASNTSSLSNESEGVISAVISNPSSEADDTSGESSNGEESSNASVDDVSDTSIVSEDASEDASDVQIEDASGVASEDVSADSSDSSNDAPSADASNEPSSKEPVSEDKSEDVTPSNGVGNKEQATAKLDKIPAYTDKNYVVINNNTPYFSAQQLSKKGYETYGELDSLGRCTYAIASCGKDTLPTKDRGSISSVKPTGWIQANYSCIKTGDLYNRSHLIAWSLTGEDANKQNLVTGTAHLNQTVMTEFEDMILDYIKETGNHVAYRVTPLFKGNELVCRGIQMEAYSVEDDGDGICFNVYCYNVQPGVIIDYATGKSQAENPEDEPDDSVDTTVKADYILNTSSKKIHLPECSSVTKMSEKNKQAYNGTIEDLLDDGYTRCGTCLAK